MLSEESDISSYVARVSAKMQYEPSHALNQLKEVKNPDGLTSAGTLQ